MISSRPSTYVSKDSAPATSSSRFMKTAEANSSSASRVSRCTAFSSASLSASTASEVAVGVAPARARRIDSPTTASCSPGVEVTTRSTGTPLCRPGTSASIKESASSRSSASPMSVSSRACSICSSTQRSAISSSRS